MQKLSNRLFLLFVIMSFAFGIFGLTSCTSEESKNSLKLSFEQIEYEVEVGEQIEISPIVTNAGEEQINLVWKSYNTSVVLVNDGVLEGVTVGKTEVKVYVSGQQNVFATVTVKVTSKNQTPVATFNEVPATLYVGEKFQLTYELANAENECEFVYQSLSDAATVDATGLIEVLAEGYGLVTVKVTDKTTGQYVSYNFAFKTLVNYDIIYVLNEGTNNEENPEFYIADQKDVVLKEPTRLGCNFIGWFEDETLTKPISVIDVDRKEDITLYAAWEAIEYKITYLDEDGNVAAEEEMYTILKEVELPTLVKKGYKFLGWAVLDAEGNESENYITLIEKGTTGDITLVAKFGELMIRVASTFDTSKDYVLGMYQGSKKQTLYMTGTLSGYYGATTTNFDNAAKLNVVETNGGYHLKLTLKDGSVKYICVVKSGSYNNIKFNNSPSNVWTYNEKYNTFTTKVGTSELFLGTYNSFTTFSASYTSYLTSSTNYISHLYEQVVIDDKMRAEMALDKVTLENNLTEDYELPEYENITFELAEDYENAKLEDGVLKVTRPENFEDDVVIKLIGTSTYKKAVATKEFEIIIAKKDPEKVTSVTVTDENLGLGAYANGEKVVTGVKFSYTQLGKYSDDIQMRYKNNIHSSICNVTPFKKLEKVIITLSTGKTGYNNKDALLIEFGTDDTYSDYSTTMSTVSGQAVYEILPDEEIYTYVRISHNMSSYTVYVASIEFVYAPELVPLATFEFGDNGDASHKDNNSSKSAYSEENNNYKLSLTNGTSMYDACRDAKGNSCLKLGTSSKTGSFKFTVPENITKVIIYVAGYKAKTVKINVNGTVFSINNLSNNGDYYAIEIDTTSVKTISFATTTNYRCMINTIQYWGY